MKTLRVFPALLILAAFALSLSARGRDDDKGFHLVEATIADIEQAFRSDVLEPEQLVRMYLARIAAYDGAGPHLNAYMHVNEHAVDAARALKEARRSDDDGDRARDRDDSDRPLW